jgi:hypothetical protein
VTWNYRVVQTDEGFGIYEVYYMDDKVGRTESPVIGPADSERGLYDEILMITRAFVEPILSDDLKSVIPRHTP